MDPMFLAMSLCRRRKFEQCVEICSDILSKNPYDQVGIVSGEFIIMNVCLVSGHFTTLPVYRGTFRPQSWTFRPLDDSPPGWFAPHNGRFVHVTAYTRGRQTFYGRGPDGPPTSLPRAGPV